MERPVLCLLLLVCGFSAIFGDDHGESAPLYNAEDFDQKVAANPHLIMFFAPWCGHCKRLAPTWNKLAEKYNADPKRYGASIARVDCTLQTALCKKNEVSGYPTLKFFKEGAETVRHRGARDQETLEKFISEQLGVQQEEKKVPEATGKNVVDLTTDTFLNHIDQGFHFVKFYAPWCPHCVRLEGTWEELATKFKDDEDIGVSRVDCTQHKDICTSNQVAGYPTLLWFADGEKVEKYAGSRGLEELKSYVTKMIKQKPEKVATEEKIPDDRDKLVEDVLNLNKDTFEDSIKTGTAFVKFFAPWCGHCKRMAPTWEDLGKKFSDNENVKIAKVDCTQERDLCSEHQVRGFPTLILYRNGKKDVEHNGPRDLETLFNFVTDKLPRDEL